MVEDCQHIGRYGPGPVHFGANDAAIAAPRMAEISSANSDLSKRARGSGGGRRNARRNYWSEFRFMVLETTKYKSATPQMKAAISIQIFGSPPNKLAIMARSYPCFQFRYTLVIGEMRPILVVD